MKESFIKDKKLDVIINKKYYLQSPITFNNLTSLSIYQLNSQLSTPLSANSTLSILFITSPTVYYQQ